ncbi:NUDIX hydrolase [Mycobacteroides abscessus]|uniref:NUDIX hydrolase n=1 Tax=Mycobacteroides abscessus TaxID=36809 RepID=UPI0009419C40|nr:NUDIX hydrolase [Mycobacteroides abscessus]
MARCWTPSFTAGSLVYIESKDGYVLFVKGRFSSLWTLPGGFHRRRESAEDTAVREVKEETGLSIGGILFEAGQYRQKHQSHYDHVFVVDIDQNHDEIDIRPPDRWLARLEVTKCEWRMIGDYAGLSGKTHLTPEAAHALDFIIKFRGREQ